MVKSLNKILLRFILFLTPIIILVSYISLQFNQPNNNVTNANSLVNYNLEIATVLKTKLSSIDEYALGIKPTTIPKETLNYILSPVNKTNSIGQYVPSDLVYLPTSITSTSQQVSNLILEDLKSLVQAAEADGLTLRVVSGYRSYNSQVTVFNNYVNEELRKSPGISRAEAERRANQYSAYPGHSEHQLGTTVDLLSSENNYSFDVTDNLKYPKWIEENASKFNFTISFKKGNPEYVYEPWHIRWRPA